MIRPIAIIVSLFVTVVSACSVPDGDDMGKFLEKIRSMDPGAGRAARLAEARQRAIDGLSERDPGDTVGRVYCRSGSGSMTQRISVDQILECLKSTSQLTFALCLETRIADIESTFLSTAPMAGKDSCEYVPEKAFQADDKWDPDQIDEGDLARSAFASPSAPPAWMIAAGVVAIGAGGVFVFASGWGLVLCPLDLEYGCPGDPMNPGADTTPGSSSSGGDR